jgi:integrase
MKTRLTVKNVTTLAEPPSGQTDYFDKMLPGFCLRVSANGARSYCCTYRVNRKFIRQTIGPAAKITLAQARDRARVIFAAVAEGRDPRADRRSERLEAARADSDTFAGAVDDFIQKYSIGKRNNRGHGEQRRLLLKANSDWHARPVSGITKREVSDVLDGMVAEGKGYTANRTFEVLSTFFKWLDQRDRAENIMAKIEKPFDGEQARTRVWSDAEIASIWKSACKLPHHEMVYTRLLLLMGQRRDEIAGMRWDELDLEAGTWSLPVVRAKGKRDHLFPLPATAVRLLRSIERIKDNPFVFPGRKVVVPMVVGQRLQDRIKKASSVEDFTFHDARRTFRTGLDALKIPPHVKDECLNHARRGVGDVHYSHYDYLKEQREAFDAWEDRISKLVYPKGVVGLRG